MLGSAETNKDGLLTNFLPALFCTTAITYMMYIIILNTCGFVLHTHYHLLIHICTIAMSRSYYVCTGCIYMRTHTCNHIRIYVHTYVYTYLHKQVNVRTVRLIKKFTFRTVVNIHICVVHLTYLTLLLPHTYVLVGVRVYRLKFLRSLVN